jgi:putative peptidoglycan lipid II flippase
MVALGPELAGHANRGDFASFRRSFTDGFRLMALVVLPASGVMIVLAGAIVNAVLRYGSFSAHSASLTAGTLTAFGIGLLCFSAYLYTLRAFYAMQDTRTPFVLNCIENGINIVLAFALYPWLGVKGLALSWSLAYIVASLLALASLRRRLGNLDGRRNVGPLARIALASAAATLVVGVVGLAVGHETTARAVLACTAAIGLGSIVYLATLRALRVPELHMLRDALRRRPVAPTVGPLPLDGAADA